MVSNIDRLAQIEVIDYAEIPGPHMTIERLMEIRSIIQDLVKRDDISGVIITHGTDSLEETAYFLDLTIDTPKPVVVVGAMRNSSELGYDGPSNLAAAVCTAISPFAMDKGVLVVLNNEVNLAVEVTKTNTLSLNTFQSPYGPIGTIDTNALIVHRNILLTKQFINTNTIETKVHLIKSYLDMDDSLINCAVNAGAKGIVIEAMGRGNLPPRALSGVNYALENNVVVVIVSRCPYGRVMESYGYEGGGKDLTARGVILGGELNGQKARLKLMVSLGYTNNIEEIKDIFKIS